MILKSIDQITEKDLQSLIDNAVVEGENMRTVHNVPPHKMMGWHQKDRP